MPLLLVVLSTVCSALAIPVTVQHQGRLLDAAGGPLNGPVTVQVSLHDSPTAPAALWSASYDVVAEQGFYTLSLGDDGSLDAAKVGGERWLSVGVDGQTLGPRSPLHPVPYAVHADEALSMGAGNIRPAGTTGLRVGNTVYNAWAASVPSTFNGQGYAAGKLQMQTELTCGNGQGQSYMWHLEFIGHDFTGNSPFRVVSVGYSQTSYQDEIQNVGGHVDYGAVSVTPYCSTDDFLSFEIGRTGGGQWHASDMTVNILHGGSGYEARFTDGFAVRAAREGGRY